MNAIKTIQFYVIRENDILHLTLKYKDRPWKIYVEYVTGDPVEVGVFQDKSLDQVRIRIFDQDVVLCDENNNEYDYTKSLTGNNIKDKQTIYAQKTKANVDVPIQANEANADQGRSRPATPPVASRPETLPSDHQNGTFRRRADIPHRIDNSEIVSKDENESLSVDGNENEDDAARNQKSNRSRRTVKVIHKIRSTNSCLDYKANKLKYKNSSVCFKAYALNWDLR
jgi:hypothetical protein